MTGPVSIERLEKAILIWEAMAEQYKTNMRTIKSNCRFTWWFRPVYWRNERYFNKSFGGLIKRRIQLQTAIKAQKEN